MKLTYLPAKLTKPCQRRCDRNIAILSPFVLLGAAIVYYGYLYYNVEQFYFYKHYTMFVKQNFNNSNRSSRCVLPNLDPWDKRAIPYYFKVPPITCKKIQPFLTEVTLNGTLQWNLTEYNSVNIENLDCFYQEFTRTDKNDFTISKFRETVFFGKVQLKEAYVIVSCTKNNTVFYNNVHSWIPPKIYADLKPSDDSKPNVQIFMLDAVSGSNFIRQLPSTYKVLIEDMSSVELKGLIKVGHNTFPNLGAMLTGINVHPSNLPSIMDGYDVWPFIWNNFSQAGYITSFAEDMPSDPAFNYKKRGFNHQPTDYYMRPFWLAMLNIYTKFGERSSENCFGNIPEHQFILDFIKQSLIVFKNYSFFTLTSLGALSHDELNSVQVLDDELAQLFRWFHENHSQNTILIVMSDHGINYGSYRNTEFGRTELAMPFFTMYLPQNLRKLYPNLEMNLRINQHRMSSWFDVYDTLMDIVTLRFDEPRSKWSKFGISLFHPHPTTRTCYQAGIPSEYCPCEKGIQLSPKSANDLTKIANDVIKYVNDLLINLPQCTPLSLAQVNSAFKIIPHQSTAKAKGFQNVVRLTIAVKPNGALLEATMKSDAWSRVYLPVGLIIRLNEFDDTVNCTQDRILRHYCCCHC